MEKNCVYIKNESSAHSGGMVEDMRKIPRDI